MRVIGIDPGISHTGYGLVDADEQGRLTHIRNGSISTSTRAPFVERLFKIHKELDLLFQELQPDHMVVEQVFFAKNARSALLLGQARGVAILSAALAEITVFEYAATEAKKAVCNYGHAGKAQVGFMVKKLLRLEADVVEHASDALALCICHVHSFRTLQATQRCL